LRMLIGPLRERRQPRGHHRPLAFIEGRAPPRTMAPSLRSQDFQNDVKRVADSSE
jgi:hypothetical protein